MVVSEFVEMLRGSFQGSEVVYTQGSCLKLAIILARLFGTAIYWSDEKEHAISEYWDKYYDITGEVIKTDDYRLITPDQLSELKDTRFRFDLQGYVCPNCDEIFAYEEVLKYNKEKNGK